MKVAEIISDTNIGGAGVLLVNRLRHTDRREFESVVLLPEKSRLCPEFAVIGVPVREVRGCADASFRVRGVFSIWRELRRLRPDIVNCHGCLSGRVAARLAGVPLRVHTRHCAFPVPAIRQEPLVRRLTGRVDRMLSQTSVAVAGAAAENLVQMGVSPEKIRVIINGSEPLRRIPEAECRALRKKYGLPEDCVTIGICARLEACKGHECLLQAARILREDGYDYRFLLIGEGSMRERLILLSCALGVAEKVVFTGFQADVAPLMNLVRIQVNCSVGTETSSLALSEGMSLGIPAVVSDFGGNPYMVRDGENGYVYPAGDPQALAQAIRRLVSSPQKYREMSEQARRRFETELNAVAMTRRTEALYRELYRKLQVQQKGCHAEIDHQRNGVHDGRDKGTCHHGGVQLQAFGKNRQRTAHKLCHDHRGKKGDRDHQGDQRRGAVDEHRLTESGD